jgi:glucokinase
MQTIAIGVDVGGSHVSCMAYNLVEEKLLNKTFAETDLDNHGQPDEIISSWGSIIKKIIELVGLENVAGVGFAMPGPYDYVNGISLFEGQNGKFEHTFGMNVPRELRKLLKLPNDFKIRFINDATAFAIGEDQVGKAKDYKRSLSVTLGTGFGSAFIRDGLPVVEGSDVPVNGCLWHLPFEGAIADDYFSTRGLLSRFEKATGQKLPGVKQIAEQATSNLQAKLLFNDFGEKMAAFLMPWIEKFGIEVFVIGGNISRAYQLFGPSLLAYLENAGLKMNVSISELKETAAFIGSATLVDDEFYQKVLPSIARM